MRDIEMVRTYTTLKENEIALKIVRINTDQQATVKILYGTQSIQGYFSRSALLEMFKAMAEALGDWPQS